VIDPNISAWRREVCGDLTSTLEFADPDTSWPALPDTSGNIGEADATCRFNAPRVPNRQALPRQEAGQRPACALPYELHADGRVDSVASHFWIDFANTGSAGAAFNVYSQNRSDGPWFYTVGAGKEVSDYWSAVSYTSGRYDLRAYGPNGFLREFIGDMLLAGAGKAQPEIETIHDATGGSIILRLRNNGSAPCTLTVKPNRYSTEAARTHTLAAGTSVDDAWAIADHGHWYDLSITSSSDASYLRRLAGHMETGAASMSDPAIGA
jgi:phospholipase C